MEDVDSPSIVDSMHSLMHHLKSRVHQALRDEADALPPMEARALAYFARHPGHTQTDLVQHAGRDKAQIARIVKTLQTRGLLASEPSPTDGRSHCLALTPTGRAAQRRMQQHRARAESQLLDCLSPDQQQQLQALLAHMVAAARSSALA